jgi:ABC-type nitrate/sulfonate/bicarbonate transport system substrate-binding protein
MKTNSINLKIGGVPEHFNLPWKLAMEEGLFREHDIRLHWEDMGGGTGQMIRGLENKSLDIAVLLTEGVSQAILQGLEAKIIQVYVTSALHWGIHVPVHSNIQSISDLKEKSFAISREGSGSHLMSFVLADQQGWDLNSLNFEVVGDIYGGLWALDNNKAQGFLWEKYTTRPHVQQDKCRFIDEVITPWPCFCIAVRNEVIEESSAALKTICDVVNSRAEKLKNSDETIETIAWRYNLNHEDVRNWLSETEWNYTGKSFDEDIENTVEYLKRLGLLNTDQIKNWKDKLLVSL